MPRIVHFLAIILLIGSAVYVYRIKYESMSLTSEVSKLNRQIFREKDLIATLRAEWQFLNRPDRLQALAEAHSDLNQMTVQQIIRWQDLPSRQASIDSVGDKLMALGLMEQTSTPASAKLGDAKTPELKLISARKP